MPWGLLLDWRVWVAAAVAALVFYAASQHIGWQASKAEFAQFQANTEKLAAEAKARNAQEAAQQARNAQEALDDLQTRHTALSSRYASLRPRPGGSGVPQAGAGPALAVPGAGGSVESDADARCLAALEWGDGELAKYAELWRLQEKDAR